MISVRRLITVVILSAIVFLWIHSETIQAQVIAGAESPGLGKDEHPQTDSRNRRAFTVQDAIEMCHFVNYSASEEVFVRPNPIFSPDRKLFLLITERGILSSNRTESTIWLFFSKAVADYISLKSTVKPAPKMIASMSATSDMPVISGVRWLNDSKTITFLGKNGSPFQQLFTADIRTGRVSALTSSGEYVSGYDIRGDVLAYTTLLNEPVNEVQGDPFVSVLGKTIDSLLYPYHPIISNSMSWSDAESFATTLHVRRSGKDLPLAFTIEGKPLKRWFHPSWSLAPPLSISPDGHLLITLAPVKEIPSIWGAYEPGNGWNFLRLKGGDLSQVREDNPYKPLQFVVVDLLTGKVAPLLNAPIGRSLDHIAPTEAFWLGDGRHAVVTNTFLPLDIPGATDISHRSQSTVIVSVDVATHTFQPIAYLDLPIRHLQQGRDSVDDITWDAANGELGVIYRGMSVSSPLPPEIYQLRSGEWSKRVAPAVEPPHNSVVVTEAFNDPPVLSISSVESSGASSAIWDPNPQLAKIALGKVSVYSWKDKDGRTWPGLIALPPDYVRGVHYPVVIQTHGVELKKYFVDGMYTTGSPGRALVAKGIIVLQMADAPATTVATPDDGPIALSGFESAIDQMESDGLIDRQRVGVIGFSYTCFHTLYALTHAPALFAAATITDGNNMSYSQYIFDEGGGGNQQLSDQVNGGTPWGQEHLMNWVDRAPDFTLDKVRTPLLISAFERGQLLRQWEPYAGLRRLGKPVDMLWLTHEDAPHQLVKPYHRYVSQQSAVDWFDFWLKGREDNDSAKSAQYARWRELRKVKTLSQTNTANAPRK